ncbi:MAG: polyisoprenoid-binding protein YceI, partial [Myxococcota bacterium]
MTQTNPSNLPRPWLLRRFAQTPWVALAATAGAGARYLLQGDSNVYTNTAQTFYAKQDEVIGWVALDETRVWLGLEALGILAAVMVGTFVAVRFAGFALRRVAKGKWNPTAGRVAMIAAGLGALFCMVSPAVPITAFASGFPPSGARTTFTAAEAPNTIPNPTPTVVKAAGPLAVNTLAGTYKVTRVDKVSLVVAKVEAGGETFDATFGPAAGQATVVASDFAKSTATFEVPSASVDTGIALRTSHAKDYLKISDFASITVQVNGLGTLDAGTAPSTGDAKTRPSPVTFQSSAKVTLMGKTLDRPVSGDVTVLTAERRAALKLTGEMDALLVNASLGLPIKETP